MTHQIQRNNSKEKQHIKTGLIAAKNYLEQQLELAGQKRTILFENHNSLVFFYDQQRNLVASLQKGTLHIFFKDNCKFEKMQTQQVAVFLENIQSKRALYCKRCRKWLEYHEGLIRCRCGKYLKTRKRFYTHNNQIEDSDELAEIQFAIQDIKDAKRIETKKRRKETVLSGITDSIAGRYVLKGCNEPVRQKSSFVERTILKVKGRIVPDEYKIPVLMELYGISYNCEQSLNYSKKEEIEYGNSSGL
jgi:hypothetical protein